MFFKRLSDVHDEEYQTALEESEGDEEYARFPQNYRFQVPEGCHWRDVRAVTTNVGQALQTALRGVERANPETLYSIFGDAQWTNKDRLSDALRRDLIEHFSRIAWVTGWRRPTSSASPTNISLKNLPTPPTRRPGVLHTALRGTADGQHPRSS